MKNVTIETLLKGMSPFALALLLSASPAVATDAAAPKEGTPAVTEETVTAEKETVVTDAAPKAEHKQKRSSSKKKVKHHRHHVSNPKGLPNDADRDMPEALVEIREPDGRPGAEDVYADDAAPAQPKN